MASSVRKAMTFFGLAAEAPSEEEGVMMNDEEMAEVTPFPGGAQTPSVSRGVHDEIHRIVTVHPRTYNDARSIGESYRSGVPVIMNLSEMNDNDAKRLVDFASGLVFALRGALERVTPKVFLLSPQFVEIASSRAVAEESADLFNQS